MVYSIHTKKTYQQKKTLGVSANSNQKKSQSAQKSASKNTPMDSCDFLIEGLCLPLTVDFLGEQGIDAGGLRPSVWSWKMGLSNGNPRMEMLDVFYQGYGGFLKWWYPTTMGFLTKNDHFGVFWGYHHLRKHPHGRCAYFLDGKKKVHWEISCMFVCRASIKLSLSAV